MEAAKFSKKTPRLFEYCTTILKLKRNKACTWCRIQSPAPRRKTRAQSRSQTLTTQVEKMSKISRMHRHRATLPSNKARKRRRKTSMQTK